MTFPTSADLAGFIARLPKTETHLHIEGALPYSLLQSIDSKRFSGKPEFWEDDYRYESFPRFEEILIDHALLWYTSARRYHEAAKVIFRNLAEQNCRYVETSFHLGILEFVEGVTGPEIIRAIKSAAPEGMEVRVFAGMLRNQYRPPLERVIDDLHRWEELDGIDLHGDETLPVEDWTADVWRRNREAGKVTKAHAGEFGGPENVLQAVEAFGVKRIQHGVRVVEDPAALDFTNAHGVAFDICPISNLKLGVVRSLAEHPIRQMLEEGLVCTVSTDDPFSFGNRLSDEYAALARDLDFSPLELARVARNGFEVSLLPKEVKSKHFTEIDRLAEEFSSKAR